MLNKVLISTLVATAMLDRAAAFHTPGHAAELKEMSEITHALAGYVVDELYDYAASEQPGRAEDCVRKATGRIIDFGYGFIQSYCAKTTNSIGLAMCEAASADSKFTAGSLLSKIKPAYLAAAYCAGQLDLEKPLELNKLIFSEESYFDGLETNKEAIYVLDSDADLNQDLTRLQKYTDCNACVTETKILAVEYLFAKWSEICSKNFSLGAQNENKLLDFTCGLLSFDTEFAKGMLFTQYSVPNYGCGFCLGSGACGKKGDNTLDMPGFFKAYHARRHASSAQQQKTFEQQQVLIQEERRQALDQQKLIQHQAVQHQAVQRQAVQRQVMQSPSVFKSSFFTSDD